MSKKLLEKYNLTPDQISATIKRNKDMLALGKAILRKEKRKWSKDDIAFFASVGVTDQFLNS